MLFVQPRWKRPWTDFFNNLLGATMRHLKRQAKLYEVTVLLALVLGMAACGESGQQGNPAERIESTAGPLVPAAFVPCILTRAEGELLLDARGRSSFIAGSPATARIALPWERRKCPGRRDVRTQA